MILPFYKIPKTKSRGNSWIADCIRFEYDIICELEEKSGVAKYFSPITKSTSLVEKQGESQTSGQGAVKTFDIKKTHIVYFPGNRDLVRYLEYKNLRPENMYSHLAEPKKFELHIYDPFARFKHEKVHRARRVNETEFDLYNSGISMVNELLEHGVPEGNIILHGYSMGGAVATAVAAMAHRKGIRIRLYNERSFSGGYEVARYFLPELLLMNYSKLSRVLSGVLTTFSYFIRKWIDKSLARSNFSLNVVKFWDQIPPTHKTCVVVNNAGKDFGQILMKSGKTQFFAQKTHDGIIAQRASIYAHEKCIFEGRVREIISSWLKSSVTRTGLGARFVSSIRKSQGLTKKLGQEELEKIVTSIVLYANLGINGKLPEIKIKFSAKDVRDLVLLCIAKFEDEREFSVIRPILESSGPMIRGHDYPGDNLINANGKKLSEHVAEFLGMGS